MASPSSDTHPIQTQGCHSRLPLDTAAVDHTFPSTFNKITPWQPAFEGSKETCVSCGHSPSHNNSNLSSLYQSYPMWPSTTGQPPYMFPPHTLGHYFPFSSAYPPRPIGLGLHPHQPVRSHFPPTDQISTWWLSQNFYPLPSADFLPSVPQITSGDGMGLPDWSDIGDVDRGMASASSHDVAAGESMSICPSLSMSSGFSGHLRSDAALLGNDYGVPSVTGPESFVGDFNSSEFLSMPPSTAGTIETLKLPESATIPPGDDCSSAAPLLVLPGEATDPQCPEPSLSPFSASDTRASSKAASPREDTQPLEEAELVARKRTYKRRKLRPVTKKAVERPADNPFRCPDPACDFSSRYLRDVTRHLASKKHGQDAAAPKFHCTMEKCDVAPGEGFSRFDNFQRHMRSVHDVKVRASGGQRRTRTRRVASMEKTGDDGADEDLWDVSS